MYFSSTMSSSSSTSASSSLNPAGLTRLPSATKTSASTSASASGARPTTPVDLEKAKRGVQARLHRAQAAATLSRGMSRTAVFKLGRHSSSVTVRMLADAPPSTQAVKRNASQPPEQVSDDVKAPPAKLRAVDVCLDEPVVWPGTSPASVQDSTDEESASAAAASAPPSAVPLHLSPPFTAVWTDNVDKRLGELLCLTSKLGERLAVVETDQQLLLGKVFARGRAPSPPPPSPRESVPEPEAKVENAQEPEPVAEPAVEPGPEAELDHPNEPAAAPVVQEPESPAHNSDDSDDEEVEDEDDWVSASNYETSSDGSCSVEDCQECQGSDSSSSSSDDEDDCEDRSPNASPPCQPNIRPASRSVVVSAAPDSETDEDDEDEDQDDSGDEEDDEDEEVDVAPSAAAEGRAEDELAESLSPSKVVMLDKHPEQELEETAAAAASASTSVDASRAAILRAARSDRFSIPRARGGHRSEKTAKDIANKVFFQKVRRVFGDRFDLPGWDPMPYWYNNPDQYDRQWDYKKQKEVERAVRKRDGPDALPSYTVSRICSFAVYRDDVYVAVRWATPMGLAGVKGNVKFRGTTWNPLHLLLQNPRLDAMIRNLFNQQADKFVKEQAGQVAAPADASDEETEDEESEDDSDGEYRPSTSAQASPAPAPATGNVSAWMGVSSPAKQPFSRSSSPEF